MTNNDVLRRVRYIFDYSDQKMIALFASVGVEVTQVQLREWLKKEDEAEYKNCSDTMMSSFLNGLIIEKRGKRDGEPPKAEKRINNNAIFMKLKIALNMKADDVLRIMDLSGLSISKHELSAFFRRPDHKHFRECKDQILRNFLMGVQLKYRDNPEAQKKAEKTIEKQIKKTAKPATSSLYKSKK